MLHARACDPQFTDLDRKITARSVANRYDISVRTLDRWLIKPHLAFPKPVMFTHDIAGRVSVRFWRLGDLIEWEGTQTSPSPTDSARPHDYDKTTFTRRL